MYQTEVEAQWQGGDVTFEQVRGQDGAVSFEMRNRPPPATPVPAATTTTTCTTPATPIPAHAGSTGNAVAVAGNSGARNLQKGIQFADENIERRDVNDTAANTAANSAWLLPSQLHEPAPTSTPAAQERNGQDVVSAKPFIDMARLQHMQKTENFPYTIVEVKRCACMHM